MSIWIAVMELKSCHQVILLHDTNEVHRNADCHSILSNQTKPNRPKPNAIKCNRIVSILPTFASSKKSDLFNTIVCSIQWLLYNFDSSINSCFNGFNALSSWAFKLKAKCYLPEKLLRIYFSSKDAICATQTELFAKFSLKIIWLKIAISLQLK